MNQLPNPQDLDLETLRRQVSEIRSTDDAAQATTELNPLARQIAEQFRDSNYSPTMLVMNLGFWNGLSKEHQEIVREASKSAQRRVREATESVDTLEGQGASRAEGHDGQRGQPRTFPQGGAREDLAELPEAIRRPLGTDRQGRASLTYAAEGRALAVL